MFRERVNHFNIVTEFSELQNKNIQQIDLSLLEFHLANENRDLLANGLIHRQIRYRESDGRLRFISDQIQFVVSMGKSMPEPVPLFKADIKQNYFILQSSKGLAILEQGFLLTIRRIAMESNAIRSKILRLNSIIKKGQDSSVVIIPVKFQQALIQPKSFNGAIRFINYKQLPVAEALINGVITYRTCKNALQEVDFSETAGMLLNVPVPGLEQSFFIYGSIRDVCWQPELTGEIWQMELKLDYHWFLTEPKELICEDYDSDQDPSTKQIQTLLKLDSRSFDFIKNLHILLTGPAFNVKIDLEQIEHQTRMTKKGRLLCAKLIMGISFINSNGFEQYQEFQTQIEELFSFNSEEFYDPGNTIESDLKIKIKNLTIIGQDLDVVILCQYYLDTYRNQISTVTEDPDSSELIYAKTLVAQREFSLSAMETLVFNCLPIRVVEVKSILQGIKAEVKNGWIIVKGRLDVYVSYLDRKRILREDLFQCTLRERYIWDKLNDVAIVEINAKIDHDNFRLVNTTMIYQYLVSISAEAFYEKELKIATTKKPTVKVSQRIKLPDNKLNSRSSLAKLVVEGKTPLLQRNICEIVTGQALLSSFDYRNSHNALLVQGSLSGKVEYWDDRRYLQQVTVDLPFWRFVPKNPYLRQDRYKLIPQIKNYSFLPSRVKPGWKQSVIIRCELEIVQEWEGG